MKRGALPGAHRRKPVAAAQLRRGPFGEGVPGVVPTRVLEVVRGHRMYRNNLL